MRVIKLGGSLLERAGLIGAFRGWLVHQPPDRNLVVVGGGQLADAIREADRLHGLDASAAHWLAIRTMGLNAELLHALLPESQLVRNIAEAPDAGIRILDPWKFLREDEPSPSRLPHGWHVTSDSIAARVTAAIRARELVLLKSRLPTAPGTLTSAAQEGYVDVHFPVAAARLQVRCVDLTHDHFPDQVLHAEP